MVLFCGGYKIRLQFQQQISYYQATENPGDSFYACFNPS
jgi:hypothetical protein